jgi:preprotein translocase subunit SecG
MSSANVPNQQTYGSDPQLDKLFESKLGRNDVVRVDNNGLATIHENAPTKTNAVSQPSSGNLAQTYRNKVAQRSAVAPSATAAVVAVAAPVAVQVASATETAVASASTHIALFGHSISKTTLWIAAIFLVLIVAYYAYNKWYLQKDKSNSKKKKKQQGSGSSQQKINKKEEKEEDDEEDEGDD